MSFSLIRNSRIFFTTNVDAVGNVLTSGLDNTNMFEIQVLDGFGFTQSSSTETVTLNEAGATPVRGQRSYNTALNPVDFNFSTYVRPQNNSGVVTAEEKHLWNALFSNEAVGQTNASWTDGAGANAPATCNVTHSDKHQLQAFGLIVFMDESTFIINNCVLTQATLDFGIDAIATVAWTGQGSTFEKIVTPTWVDNNTNFTVTAGTYADTYSSRVWDDGVGGDIVAASRDLTADYIANRLSVVAMEAGINGAGAGNPFTIPLTGGSLTINNNVTFLVPATLGVVNTPITYFAGTRAISGQISAYLRTGATTDTGALFQELLGDIANTDSPYQVEIKIGGSTAPKVTLTMPACVVTIPDISAEQVISATFNFTAQSQNAGGTEFDITEANELTIAYDAIV